MPFGEDTQPPFAPALWRSALDNGCGECTSPLVPAVPLVRCWLAVLDGDALATVHANPPSDVATASTNAAQAAMRYRRAFTGPPIAASGHTGH